MGSCGTMPNAPYTGSGPFHGHSCSQPPEGLAVEEGDIDGVPVGEPLGDGEADALRVGVIVPDKDLVMLRVGDPVHGVSR